MGSAKEKPPAMGANRYSFDEAFSVIATAKLDRYCSTMVAGACQGTRKSLIGMEERWYAFSYVRNVR